MKPIVIGLAGRMWSGKTTTAQEILRQLSEQGRSGVILSLATPLKDLARSYFGWNGQKDERGRRLLQRLGTDVGREWDPDFSVKKWLDMACRQVKVGISVICDDLRFANEAAALRELGGHTFVCYSGRSPRSEHASENAEKEFPGLPIIDTDVMTPAQAAALAIEGTRHD